MKKTFSLDSCLRKIVPCTDMVAVEMSLHTGVCPGMLMTVIAAVTCQHFCHMLVYWCLRIEDNACIVVLQED